ncbi:hypothetical protein FKR81_19015 [Lentzea tibetensis]|uniref:Uncharacterized protein n=1 Tax=Lentzea tibetensis TaxID=2591470 RepID=A0A563ET83_9PSEU|nr:hypothetical protein [Lentzea tibetensis]TWP50701.1 hypothetical protein FKR81_19015 [Lentzea tibetensis]
MTKFMAAIGDKLLAKLVPSETAHADRYRCYYTGVWYRSGCYLCRQYCCVDDYTGEISHCTDPCERVYC